MATTWFFGPVSPFSAHQPVQKSVESSDGVESIYVKPASGVRKHGAFTLVRELGAELLASLSLLDRLAPCEQAIQDDHDQHCTVPVESGVSETGSLDFSINKPEPLASTTSYPYTCGTDGSTLQASWIPRSGASVAQFWTAKQAVKTRRGVSRRAVFSDVQRQKLEDRFLVQKYISKPDRKKLAETLGLKDSQVKVWFQNRRMKWRNTKEREYLSSHHHFATRSAIPDSEVRKYILDD